MMGYGTNMNYMCGVSENGECTTIFLVYSPHMEHVGMVCGFGFATFITKPKKFDLPFWGIMVLDIPKL